jgi:uncharacterized protein YuzE
MHVSFDPEADAVYVDLREPHGRVRTRELDRRRRVDYDERGDVCGVEFLFVSDGIDLTDVPEAERIRQVLKAFPQPAPA